MHSIRLVTGIGSIDLPTVEMGGCFEAEFTDDLPEPIAVQLIRDTELLAHFPIGLRVDIRAERALWRVSGSDDYSALEYQCLEPDVWAAKWDPTSGELVYVLETNEFVLCPRCGAGEFRYPQTTCPCCEEFQETICEPEAIWDLGVEIRQEASCASSQAA